jgi:hypothetical protein
MGEIRLYILRSIFFMDGSFIIMRQTISRCFGGGGRTYIGGSIGSTSGLSTPSALTIINI